MAEISDQLFNDESISDQLGNDEDQGRKGGSARSSDEDVVTGNLYSDTEDLSDQLWGQDEQKRSGEE